MNIYVGNLAWGATEADLQQAFGGFGEVTSVSIITDKATGRSRGFAFVEMPDRTEAETAITALNGQDLKGRPLKVNEARPRTEGGGRNRGGHQRGGGHRGDRRSRQEGD